MDQHQGSLPRLLSGPSPSASCSAWPWAGSGWPKACAPHFRIHPAHPAHRVDSADHLLVRHRPDGKVFIIWIGGIVPCVINSYVGVRMTNPVFLQMGRPTARRTGSFLDRMHPSALPMVLRRAQIALAWCWMNL